MGEAEASPGVRRAGPGDVPALVGLVHALASYERAGDDCRLTEAHLHGALFGPAPALVGRWLALGVVLADFVLGTLVAAPRAARAATTPA